MTTITEIAPDLYRISIYVPEANLQFNHFLVKDDEPMLYHTGMRRMFPLVREAVTRILDPAELRWIGFSHFEVDECGTLNEWLQVAPSAQAVCSIVGALVNMSDFADRPTARDGRRRAVVHRPVPVSLPSDPASAPRLGRRRTV